MKNLLILSSIARIEEIKKEFFEFLEKNEKVLNVSVSFADDKVSLLDGFTKEYNIDLILIDKEFGEEESLKATLAYLCDIISSTKSETKIILFGGNYQRKSFGFISIKSLKEISKFLN